VQTWLTERWGGNRPGAIYLITGVLLSLAGGLVLVLSSIEDHFSKDEVCLGIVATESGWMVLDQSLSLVPYQDVQCRPGPFLRYGEGELLDRPEFRPFLNRWKEAVALHPQLADRLSEIQLRRNGDAVFYSSEGRLRIELEAGVRTWPQTLWPLLLALEAKGWNRGFIDLKDEDALLIQAR
jgi:hypothetical protein